MSVIYVKDNVLVGYRCRANGAGTNEKERACRYSKAQNIQNCTTRAYNNFQVHDKIFNAFSLNECDGGNNFHKEYWVAF